MRHPVKVAAVHDRAADVDRVTVHIFGGGMGHNVRAELNRTAVDRRGKGVVHDERHAVFVRQTRELFDIQHGDRGIGDGLAEHSARVGTERLLQLLLGERLVNKGHVDAHLFHGDAQQVVGAAVDSGGSHDMAACLADIEQGKKVCRLSAGGQHAGNAAFERGDLGSYHVIGGVLQTGVKISCRLQVKQLAHVVGGIIFPSGALINRKLTRLAVGGFIACVQAFCFYIHVYISF